MTRQLGRRLGLSLLLLAICAAAQPAHEPLKFESPMQDKNFYLLSVVEQDKGVRRAAKKNPTLAKMMATRREALDNAAKTCKSDVTCITTAFRWTEEQIDQAAKALSTIDSLNTPLETAGVYVRYKEERIAKAWADCARAMNRIIDVYALGKPPRYAAIDSMTYDANTDSYKRVLQVLLQMMESQRTSFDLFFSTSLKFTSELLELNHRDEAGRLEPLETGENAAAYQRVRSVDWQAYPYSAIVVLGSGNDRPGIHLSHYGKLRDEIAAALYMDGKAPFILVSGGYVHPARTEYNEALEMKRDLTQRFHIPSEAILVDPHARHTTTNIRNAARILYRYGIPFDKKALITTDQFHSESIESAGFNKRCIEELGYVPHRIVGRTSPFDLEFLPSIESLQIDPQDPLDP